MNFMFVIKSIDLQCWVTNPYVISFKTEKEAYKFCKLNSNPESILYSWEKVLIGKINGPFRKKPRMIHVLP